MSAVAEALAGLRRNGRYVGPEDVACDAADQLHSPCSVTHLGHGIARVEVLAGDDCCSCGEPIDGSGYGELCEACCDAHYHGKISERASE